MTISNVIRLVAFATVVSVFATACKKKPSSFGKEVYDPEMLLDADGVDTFSIIAFSELIDSTFTKNARHGLLGAYNDPVFGKVSASFYTQLRLTANNPNFGDLSTITIDSVVLALEYRDQYGIGRTPQNFGVYRLTESLSADSNYLINSETSTSGEQLIENGFSMITPDVTDRPVVGADTLLPQLRIRLKTSLGMELLTSSQSGNMLDNDAFLSYFKGLHVVTEDANVAVGAGAVYSLDLIDPDSKLTVYYTQNDEKKLFDLAINNSAVYYNRVNYELGSPVQSLIQNPQLGNKEFYAQTGNVRAIVRFPGVMNLGQKTVIHRATLYLPYTYFNGDDRYPSPELVAFNRRADGDLIWGLTQTQPGVISPRLHQISPQFKRYTIDVTDFVQGLIKQDNIYSNPEIIITGSRTNDNVERIIFNGVETPNKYKPKLIITYTKF